MVEMSQYYFKDTSASATAIKVEHVQINNTFGQAANLDAEARAETQHSFMLDARGVCPDQRVIVAPKASCVDNMALKIQLKARGDLPKVAKECPALDIACRQSHTYDGQWTVKLLTTTTGRKLVVQRSPRQLQTSVVPYLKRRYTPYINILRPSTRV